MQISFIDEFFNFIWSSGIIQTIAGEANANEGLLALVGLTVTVTLFVGRLKWLRIPAAGLAIATLFATYVFLSPRDGEMATIAELKSATQAPLANDSTAQTIQPTPRSTPRQTPTYTVTGVDCDDVLNVRSAPALFSDGAVVGQLSCTEDRIVALGNTRRIGFSEWWKIKTPATLGWVNARYLLPNQLQVSQGNATACAPIQGAVLTNDRSYSQCQIVHLFEGRNAESTWTGECDQQNRAHGLGISRTYTDVEQERRLTAVFFGHISHGTEFSGTLSRNGAIQPVCSRPTGLEETFDQTTRTNSLRNGLLGIEAGINVLNQNGDQKAVQFYIDFKGRLRGIR